MTEREIPNGWTAEDMAEFARLEDAETEAHDAYRAARRASHAYLAAHARFKVGDEVEARIGGRSHDPWRAACIVTVASWWPGHERYTVVLRRRDGTWGTGVRNVYGGIRAAGEVTP